MKRNLMIFATIFLLFSCRNAAEEQQSARNYKTVEIQPTTVMAMTSYSASLQGKQDIAILPQISGFLTKLCVTEGQRVSKGQVLFEIDRVNFEAALRVAEADVKAAEAAVATNQLTYDSKKKLYDEKVISKFDLQLAENNLLTAKAHLAQAQAGVTNARQNLSYTLVKSPCNGVVGKLPFREGTLVSPQMPEPLTTVSDNNDMYVYFSMSESQILNQIKKYGTIDKLISEMPEVEIELCDGTVYDKKGRIESISGVIDKQTGAVSVRAAFPNPDKTLLSGGSCNILLPATYDSAILIPQSATYEIQNKVFAYKVVNGKTVATMLEVTALPNGKQYVVTKGLEKGDLIIAEGAGLIKEGEAVEL